MQHAVSLKQLLCVQQNKADDDDWGEDFSEEAVKQRMEELSGAAKGLALTDDLEKTDKDRMDILYTLIKVSAQSSISARHSKRFDLWPG